MKEFIYTQFFYSNFCITEIFKKPSRLLANHRALVELIAKGKPLMLIATAKFAVIETPLLSYVRV
jgi:hypothetical protein